MLGRSAAVAGAAALLASLADLAAASIEVDEEGVMHNRGGLVEARDFDLKKLKAVHSGTHDQADVAVGIPLDRLGGNVLIEWNAALELLLLDILRSVIGSEAEEEHAFFPAVQERGDGILAHERIDGDRVGTQLIEKHPRVHLGCRADVSDLGVDDNRDVLGGALDRRCQCRPAGFSQGAVESEVGLVGAGQVGGCLDEGLVEGENRIELATDGGRKPLRVRI